ncbi:MAG: XdhC family protein [Halobacteriales archaeon]
MNLFERADELVDRGEPAAMLTVVAKDGSAPREVGTRMLVTAQDEFGTIGGGSVEGLAIEEAREVLEGQSEPGVRNYELRPGGNTGMVCGGSMDVFIDRLRGKRHVYIAGGGHIAAELAPLAARMGYAVTVIDDREEYADEARFPKGTRVIHGDYGETLAELPITSESAVVVATRSGTFDTAAVGAALDGGAGYIGLVASDTKADRVLENLAEDGFGRDRLVDVRAPVGLDLGGGGPEDVALSVLAELHADRHDASGGRLTRLDLDELVLVRGGGDLASGVVYRLHQAGFPVAVLEVEQPTAVRRAVAFAEAVYEDEVTVEGVVARRAEDVDAAVGMLEGGVVPVLVDPEAATVDGLEPGVLVDAVMAKGKRDTGTRQEQADVVIGLGPGFEAVADQQESVGAGAETPEAEAADGGPVPVDAVVETDRGHELGRVFYEGTASPYDGTPGEREGHTLERVLYADTAGEWSPRVQIGEPVEAGDVFGHVGDEPVAAEIDGLVRGLVREGLQVEAGTKLGDIDPRGDAVDPTEISDKALSLGGGVLEAVLRLR